MNILRACSAFAIIPLLTAAAAPPGRMPALSAYLMKAPAEIALARSAAPASISAHASVLVLTAHGYVTAARGENGFTCLVERPWMQPYNKPDFWNLKFRAPVCYNAAAAKSVLLYTFKRTALALRGATKAQIERAMAAVIAAKSLPVPQPDAMAYMMSKQQYLDDSAKAWYPHVMFFMPRADMANAGAAWGADRLRSPIVYDSSDVMPEPWAQFFIPVAHWSDGSGAPLFRGT